MDTASTQDRRRVRISVVGRVQGVGFRPGLYRAMTELGCGGHVRNTPRGVSLEVEGPPDTIAYVIGHFRDIVPASARIDEMRCTERPPTGERGFSIADSRSSGDSLLPVPPDLALCPDCLRELDDPSDRRGGYAFNTCTCCGPRFTIAHGVPFDRATSAMEAFPLCESCRREFTDAQNRRFHAQTMSCPACGPAVSYLSVADPVPRLTGDHALGAAAAALKSGRTVAIKGLGGFHLACDAANATAVGRIRQCKGRPHKPLSVMAADMETAGRLAGIGPDAERILRSTAAPIVLLEKKRGGHLADAVAPALSQVGVMLPYTPLHLRLFRHPETPPVLVMTSCNRSDEPIALESGSILARLPDLVDGILDHNRRIENRCDDSVVSVSGGCATVVRRSRGYVPEPVQLLHDAPSVLAVGAMWKNTFTLTRGRRAYISPHIGDVSDADNAAYFEETFDQFSRLLRIEPEVVACDLHPDYPTTDFARRLARDRGLPLHPVQHHHAHVLSCMAEHAERGPVIGVSMDGTGYGSDGRIWGGEFFVADALGCERRYHLQYVPMPGGDRAVTEPYRMALAHLANVFDAETAVDIMGGVDDELPLADVADLIGRAPLAPLTSSCGRLFDAVASLLGVRQRCTYEGQAACELEALADRREPSSYPWGVRGREITVSETIVRLWEDRTAGCGAPTIAARFHNTIVRMVCGICQRIREDRGPNTVVLTGGVMHNRLIAARCRTCLEESGFNVLTHRRIPPGDGGLSLGQAAGATARRSAECRAVLARAGRRRI